ncbi:kinase phosphorylation protein-domain-containing protein [Armillaria novae-zelandiae]|uniref:Kinase phosphorylation protein-domain-containing protein n=1 Tax=Armillaria novae-zelandiae TaxID=153914 RepID=A0AA39P9T8_9AGAR|nr:kinase phosphorylation protein-domain-containing protein [Armillaria novae-zelandiae]
MFEPIRGGTRGGQAEFKWSDVSADKDRENYLGHSINAPTGRWQKNKDVHWYNRDLANSEAERLEEIRKIKEAEAEALSVALGFAPNAKGAAVKDESSPSTSKPTESAPSPDQHALEKEERRRRKAERKEEKRAKKEQRRLERQERHTSIDTRRRREYSSSRSRSPRPRSRERKDYDDRYSRCRSRSPPTPSYHDQRQIPPGTYDDISQEKERERDRRRWDASSRRNEPGARWGRE